MKKEQRSQGSSRYFKEKEVLEGPISNERERRPLFVFKSGATYDGEWKGVARDGQGVQIWKDGAKYEG